MMLSAEYVPNTYFEVSLGVPTLGMSGYFTSVDGFAAWVHMLNQGMHMPVSGIISLKDHTGSLRRTWMVVDAMVVKYVGPNLNAMQPELAVSRIELQHNGCI